MGKGRKPNAQEYQYDEASSGSDGNASSDEEDDDELHSMKSGLKDSIRKNGNGSEDSDNDGNDDGDDNNNNNNDDDSNDSSVDSENNRDMDDTNENEDSDDNSDDEEEDEGEDEDSLNEEEAPLHQRLLKKEGRGSLQYSSRRERKSRALEEATKRLATFKKESQQTIKKRKTMGEGDYKDDDDENVETASSNRNSTQPMTTTKKKKSKNKPTEVSSKRKDFFARGARRLNESGLGVDIGAHRYKPMDPRASNLSGHYDEDSFHTNYAFLEEIRNKEIGQVRKRIAAHKATGNKGNKLRKKLQIIQADGSYSSTLEDDVARLKSLTETRANLERRKIDRAAKQSVKRKIREDVESGKTGAYFLKRKEMKRFELEARFEEIRKRGGEKAVEKILAKKRQKNKSRDASGFAK